MKPILPLLAGAAVIAAAVSLVPQSSQAQQPAGTPPDKALSYPVGVRCVVTLDPAGPATKRTGGANSDTYQILDNKLQGDLLSINSEWLVLKDGTFENWIPRDKVLSMRVSR